MEEKLGLQRFCWPAVRHCHCCNLGKFLAQIAQVLGLPVSHKDALQMLMSL